MAGVGSEKDYSTMFTAAVFPQASEQIGPDLSMTLAMITNGKRLHLFRQLIIIR